MVTGASIALPIAERRAATGRRVYGNAADTSSAKGFASKIRGTPKIFGRGESTENI